MISKKTLAATTGALALAATFALSSTPASAGWKHHGYGYGGGLAVGLLGAAIVGGAIAASQPAYAAPAYGYGGCELRQRPIYNSWGEVVGYRRPVRVCY
ncbi:MULTISPECIES: hypothetical protein [unclassified Beijerinckia]|uniref:hypothetical protein n=1 Tax=unclassified Beijerinckia TaxID=2638183 RepID=UPI00089BBFAB|nr:MULTISPECIES: hypothetical protein [unclassified Beijerinckia]MDH7797381.1 hypothetical protein [Beijerinckia sp. GAS462]SEC83323.1 hypothetical protein SAMN05443249_3675 [Beijerinckia sp. 28-YEA-48]